MLSWQWTQTSISFPIELNEDIIPDLNDVRQIGINQLCSVSSTDPIVVDFLHILSCIAEDYEFENDVKSGDVENDAEAVNNVIEEVDTAEDIVVTHPCCHLCMLCALNVPRLTEKTRGCW